MSSRSKKLPLVIALFALLLCAGPAAAETYTVTRNDDPIPGACDPGDCSLREALTAANGTATVDDVVVVPGSDDPYLIQYEELTLPISDDVEVRGGGADRTVVAGDGKEIVFTVSGAATKATLSGLTVTGGAGGIHSNGQLLTLREVNVEGNERDIDAGGVKTNGNLTIEASFIGFNRSNSGSGGGVQSNGAVSIVNSTIAHNFSKDGPGGIGANAKVTIASSAAVSNSTDSPVSAGVQVSTLVVRDSIFADNRTPTGLLDCLSTNPVDSLGGNVSDDGTCGNGATDRPNVDPLLGDLRLHGGTTAVYDLLSGSPAIDAAGECPPFDQRGVARPQGAACDSGPYEVEAAAAGPPPPPPPSDRELFMKVGKGKLALDGKGRIRVRLSCPAGESSPPCRGQVVVTPLKKYWPLKPCDCVRSRVLQSAGRRFSIGAGQTRVVAARLPRSLAAQLADRWKPRRVRLTVQAEDAVGNKWGFRQNRKLVPR